MKRQALTLLSAGALLLAGVVGSPHAQQAGAAMMSPGSISILSPTAGAVVTGNSLPVEIAVKDFTLNCALAGTAPKPGVGHWHLLLDGGLVNMECSTAAVLSLQNVAPGKHTVEVELAGNNHMALMGKGQVAKTTFSYQPASPLPALTAYKAAGKPSIAILAPANGVTVGEHFWVELGWKNFRPSCALLGKPDVPGYGHWHLYWDTMHGPMMGMGTLVNMGCTNSTEVFTDGLTPGKHTLIAALTDNLHAPLMGVPAASITINVRPGGSTTTSGTSTRTSHAAGGTKSIATTRWLSWNAATHTATLTLVAGYNEALSGFNFNGYGDGKMLISVPAGSHVIVQFSNKGGLAHSAIFTPYADRMKTGGFPLAFSGASTTDPSSGLQPGQTQHFSFVANKAGSYALVCGVPGHEAAGMWDVFRVTSAGSQPSLTLH